MGPVRGHGVERWRWQLIWSFVRCPPTSATLPHWSRRWAGARVVQGLYEHEGYHPVGNFNDNAVATCFGEKQL